MVVYKVGGGALVWFLVCMFSISVAFAEEIYFLIHPECIAARLFCEPIQDNEVIVIHGIERYCAYSGYGSEFRFMGDYVDRTAVEGNQFVRTTVAFDALKFKAGANQFSENNVLRELNKVCKRFC